MNTTKYFETYGDLLCEEIPFESEDEIYGEGSILINSTSYEAYAINVYSYLDWFWSTLKPARYFKEPGTGKYRCGKKGCNGIIAFKTLDPELMKLVSNDYKKFDMVYKTNCGKDEIKLLGVIFTQYNCNHIDSCLAMEFICQDIITND